MLSNRTAGQVSRFTIPLVDDAGNKIVGTSAAWQLFDDRGDDIDTAAVGSFDPAEDTVSFDIPAAALTLPPGITSAGRELVVMVQTAAGEIELRDYFLVVSRNPLTLMANSFQTYPEALAMRASFGPVLDGWDATLDPNTRAGAMAHAFEALIRIGYRVAMADWQSRESDYAAYGTGSDDIWTTSRPVRLRGMSIADFDALPENFRRALKRAQIIEADVLLGGDVVSKKRKAGIISETIGESSTAFSPKPYLNLPVSRQAFDEIKRFIVFRVGIARG